MLELSSGRTHAVQVSLSFTTNLGVIAPPAILAVGFESENGIICYGVVICKLSVAV